jgi:ribulose bisphosphate carboxylase small subunit
MPCTHVERALELIRMEYAEMPDLKLTFWQAQRLWDLSDELCHRALSDLTRCGFLTLLKDGSYIRRVSIRPRRFWDARVGKEAIGRRG